MRHCSFYIILLNSLQGILQEFGVLSGYKVNKDKSVLLGFHVSIHEQNYLHAISNALWKKGGIKYLGINFTNNLKDMVKINILPLFS